jgi:ectoine utilization protein EutC
MSVLIVNEQELKQVVGLDQESIEATRNAIMALATKDVVMPPILSMEIPDHNGEVDIKTAYLPGLDSFAVKISPGFFDNPKLGLPSLNGVMGLFASQTGLLEAVLLDNGYLTDLRTACAGAVAAEALARTGASVAAIFGTGLQARLQLEALCNVRPISNARIWGRDVSKAQALAHEVSDKLQIEISYHSDGAEAAKGAHILVTTTPSKSPILMADWLEPGQHITAMGSDADYKNELEPSCLAQADLYVADRLAQTEKLGELRAARAANLLSPNKEIPELGQILAGQKPGRISELDITICDLTGMGVQDTAIATLAHLKALNSGMGTHF